ncbi:MAG TPA: hypothetical protein PKW33_04355 [Anaerolineaceae bacterium]|nr:hypothetical protein [Anaerolineaceae bacterium]HPN50795.1 hypothetical protein [Anaerolineaceae bacterium]
MDTKRFSLVRPTVQTPFFIDFSWWKEHDNNWRVYIAGFLCAEHQKSLAKNVQTENEYLDWIDPTTAEVQQVDALQHILIHHCARQVGFLDEHTTVVDAVFRALLAHQNQPMTPIELGTILGKQPEIILKTLSGPQVYKGIRPRQG